MMKKRERMLEILRSHPNEWMTAAEIARCMPKRWSSVADVAISMRDVPGVERALMDDRCRNPVLRYRYPQEADA